MAEKEDKTPSKKDAKPGPTTSTSSEKPLLGEEPEVEAADIDTSHLSLDESPEKSSGSLESENEVEVPDINTSYLSLEDDAGDKPVESSTEAPSADKPQRDAPAEKSAPSENLLFVKNPLADKMPDQDSEDSPQSSVDKGPSGRVVLSSGIPDADFNDDGEQTPEATASAIESDDDQQKDSDGAIKSILDTVQKPEKIVRNAWSNSSARRFLINNVESYRAKDEDQNMESVIEKVYGGAVEKKIAPGKFLKENLLFSFLLFLFLFLVAWKAAVIFFPEFMPALNDQIIDTVKKTTGIKNAAKEKEEKKPVVTNIANKEKIDLVLSHCLVEPNTRIAFARAFTPVGYEFTNQSLTLSYDELTASINVWKKMNMSFYIKDAISRFDVLSKLALPIIQNANSAVSDYKKSLLSLEAEADELKKRIRNIQTRGGNQTTDTVNKRIPLLNKLDKINARLADEPNQARFDQLLKKLLLIEGILTGDIKPERIEPDQLTEKDPKWLKSLAETASSEITAPVNEKVLPAIKKPATKLKTVTPKLTAFNLSELESALNDLSKLSALIIYLPENMLTPYKLELSGLNRRLNITMENELATWMSFDRCLANVRSEGTASIE